MKIYALALQARKSGNRTEKLYSESAATKDARSKEEAIGIGIELARKCWPDAEGYHSHSAIVCEIPQQWINNER